MSSSTAFSSDGAEIMSRKTDPSPVTRSDLNREAERDVQKYYELERCSTFIKTHNFQKVGKGDEDQHPASLSPFFGSVQTSILYAK